MHFIQAMEKLDKVTPLKALGRSFKKKFQLKIQQTLGMKQFSSNLNVAQNL